MLRVDDLCRFYRKEHPANRPQGWQNWDWQCNLFPCTPEIVRLTNNRNHFATFAERSQRIHLAHMSN